MTIPNIRKNKIHVPNHQPVIKYIIFLFLLISTLYVPSASVLIPVGQPCSIPGACCFLLCGLASLMTTPLTDVPLGLAPEGTCIVHTVMTCRERSVNEVHFEVSVHAYTSIFEEMKFYY